MADRQTLPYIDSLTALELSGKMRASQADPSTKSSMEGPPKKGSATANSQNSMPRTEQILMITRRAGLQVGMPLADNFRE